MKDRLGFDAKVDLDSKEGALLFMVIVIMLFTVLRFVSVGIHEILGHGLFTEAAGGTFFATYISPSGGYASIDIPDDAGRATTTIIFLAGILVDILVGLIVLFFIYPRVKKFMTGLALLIFSEVLIVHSAFYLVLGAYIRDGDSFKAIYYGGLEPAIPIVLGLTMAGMFIIIISVRLVKFMSRYITMTDDRKALKSLSYFWLPPIFIIWVSMALPGEMDPGSENYTIGYAVIFTLMVMASSYFISRIPLLDFKTSEVRGIGVQKVVNTLFIFCIVLVLWVAVFGPSTSQARGLLLKEAPLEVELSYQDYSVGNLVIRINNDSTVSAAVALRFIMDYEQHSPLDQKIYESFEQRAYWPEYQYISRNMMRVAFGLNGTLADGLDLTSEMSGNVWAGGEEYPYARVSTAELNFTLLGLGGEDDGLLVLEFIDPWMTGTDPGYLDMVMVGWADDYEFVNYSSNGIPYSGGNETGNYLVWQNYDLGTSPRYYNITLRKLPDR